LNKTFVTICHGRNQFDGFEDTKEVIRIRKSKKEKQHNDQKMKDDMTNNDIQDIT